MKSHIERLRGMRDLLPATYQQQQQASKRLQDFLSQAGYAPVDVPILERSDLFLSSFRQELWQNLYTFRLHNRDHCLRPEYTASICRLYLDQYQQQALPLRLQYAGPVFRYETPGRGRFRQHTQLGIELFGGQTVAADAEMLQLACDALLELGVSAYRLELGHIGVASNFINRLHLDDHAAYLLLSLMEQISRSEAGEQKARTRLEALYPANETTTASVGSTPANGEQRYLSSLLNGLSIAFADDGHRQEIIERFTWKMGRGEQRRQILYALEFLRELHAVAGAPPEVFTSLRELLIRYEIDAEPLRELEQLVEIIEQSGVAREQIHLNLALGRGVSYYTGLVFEIHAQEADGFETQICGGGRYDALVRAIGGAQDVRACGFAFGLERLQALLTPEPAPHKPHRMLVIPVSQQDLPYALHIARTLRAGGQPAELEVTGHGVGAALKLAGKQEITLAAIVGEDERRTETVTLRNLTNSEERQLPLATFLQRFRERQG
ncbi:MAG: HisS family protein [Ktedonobacteraceae bacterium]